MSDFLARIKPKRSTVAGEKPSSLELQVAEIALNTADGKIFTKHTDGTIKEISGSGGGGGGSINAIEEIGNVQARQAVSPGVLSWDVKDDENVLGGWRYDDSAFQLSLNKEAKNGFDIRPSVVAMPTTGTIWVSFDNLTYTQIAYTNRAINAEVVIIDLVVTAPDDGFPGEIYVAFDSPYADGASFENDILKYDATDNVWRPTEHRVNGAGDWDTEGEDGIGLQDGMSMVWDAGTQKWTQGFPLLSTGGGSGGSQASTAGYAFMVGPNQWFSVEGVDPTSDGWTSLGMAADDNAFALTVPFALRGTEFFGQVMPETIYFCTNGSIHWDATQGGDSGGRSGDFLNDSNGRDFWLAFWSQDTASNGVWEKWDGNVWTIRIDFKVPYNVSSGCPVEVQFSRNGSIRVSYGTNNGSDIVLGIDRQGIASNGIRLVEGFGAASSASGAWSWAALTGSGTGRSTKDLLDVSTGSPSPGQLLTWDGDTNIYIPTDPAVASVNGKTGGVVLKIQDLDDYALEEGPAVARSYSYNVTGDETGPTDGELSFLNVSGEVEQGILVLQPDANGWDPAGAFEVGGQVWMGIDGAAPVAYTLNDVADLGPPSGTQLTIDGSFPAQPAAGTPVLIYENDPSLPQARPLTTGDVVRYDGTDFVPTPFEINSLADVDTATTPPADGEMLLYSEADGQWLPSRPELDGLSNVDVSTIEPLDGQGLIYDAVSELWKPGAAGGAGGGISNIQEAGDFVLNQQTGILVLSDKVAQVEATSPASEWDIFGGGSQFYYSPLQTILTDNLSSGDTITMQVPGMAEPFTTTLTNDPTDTAGYKYFNISPNAPAEITGAADGTNLTITSPNLPGSPIPLLEGDILQWDDTDNAFKPVQLSVTGPARRSEVLTVTGAESGTDYDVEIENVGNAGTFLQVTTSHAAWVRFYTDPDARTADVRTSSAVAPTRGDGVLLELITTGAETYKATPVVGYINLTDDLDRKLYARVTNLSGATADVDVTVNVLVLEA